MKKQVIGMLLLLTVVPLTGCNVKFIEKVPIQKEKKEEQLGSIEGEHELEDAPDKTEHQIATDPEVEKKKPEEEQEEPTEAEVNEDKFVMHGVTFNKVTPEKSMFLKYSNNARNKPNEKGDKVSQLYKGDTVSLFGISEDGVWGVIRDAGGPQRFIEMDSLTEEYIEKDKTLSGLQEETSEQQPEVQEPSGNENNHQNQNANGNGINYSPIGGENQGNNGNENQSENTGQETQPSNQGGNSSYGGIEFPANATSTSMEQGVEFADVGMLVYAIEDIEILDGPGTGSWIGTLYQGEEIKCTGIGRNGYIRVDFYGMSGFVDSSLVDPEY